MAKKKKLVIMKGNGIKIKQPAKPMPKPKKKKRDPPMKIMPVFGSSY